jgi:CIC family chloride channel protein
MAGLVSGATRAPLTAIFMVYELTNDSAYVVPLMIVSVVAYITARRFAPYGLYDGWLAARGQHLSHGVDQSIMEEMRVRDAVDTTSPRVHPAMRLPELSSLLTQSRATTLPVIDEDGAFLGLIGQHQLHATVAQPFDARQLIIAEDLVEKLPEIEPSQSLREALAAMSAASRDALPVIGPDAAGNRQFVGMITRAAAFAAYDRALEHSV